MGLEGNVPARGGNDTVYRFRVPRAGGGTAPVPPGVPLPAPERTSRHQMAYSFCGPLCPFPPPPPDDIIAMYDDISQFYSEIGDMENAFLAQNKIKLLSTEYDATNKSGKLQLLEKDLLQKSKEIDSQNKNRILLTLIITLVVILAFLFFYTKFTKTKNSLATIEIENIRKDLEKITKELDNAGQSKLNLDNYKLTERQSQIITLVKQGKTNKEIGQSLFISENTVKYHLKIIYETLNIANRSEL